jgi:hypothetical protein
VTIARVCTVAAVESYDAARARWDAALAARKVAFEVYAAAGRYSWAEWNAHTAACAVERAAWEALDAAAAEIGRQIKAAMVVS